VDYNSDTDRLREIFSVRFGLLSFWSAAWGSRRHR
jgi:hypothetical protein